MAGMAEVPAYEVRDQVRIDPAKTALTVVDMQNDFFAGEVTTAARIQIGNGG